MRRWVERVSKPTMGSQGVGLFIALYADMTWYLYLLDFAIWTVQLA